MGESFRFSDRVRDRLASLARILAASTGLLALMGGQQVFAKQFLENAQTMPTPRMVYSPERQMMVDPDSLAPLFVYSPSALHGRANGEYMVAPLVNCPGDPSCPSPPPPPPQPTHTVTPGGGPDGPGPTPDSD